MKKRIFARRPVAMTAGKTNQSSCHKSRRYQSDCHPIISGCAVRVLIGQKHLGGWALCLAVASMIFTSAIAHAEVDEEQLGAWYMYFFNYRHVDSQFGVQGDIQYRNWDLGGDLEQLLIRSGLTWRPKSTDVMLTVGYANITSGAFGRKNHSTTYENRAYQEALLPQKIGSRIYLRHRFRYEQRWVEAQDFRTRYRYALFMNIPLNQAEMSPGAVYLSLYNEIFLNGQRAIEGGRTVEVFDRNRLYAALGYSIAPGLAVQMGYMEQTTESISKGQVQISLHHTF